MTGHQDPFEEELRAALRSGGDRTQQSDAADETAQLLDRIHRGAARRRSRRRAGALAATAVLSSAILVTLPLLAPPPSTDGGDVSVSGGGPDDSERSGGARSTDGPQRRANDLSDRSRPEGVKGGGRSFRAESGVAVEVDDVKVTSVSGASDEEIWLSGYGTCDGEEPCNVLGHSSNGGADFEFTTLPGAVHSRQTTVRFSSDGETGWATDGGDVFRTDSGGLTWIPLKAPRDVRVATLEAWEDEVWAVGQSTSRDTVILSSRAGSDRLVPVERSAELRPTGAVALGSGTFGVARADGERNFSHTADGGKRWTEGAIGCEPADVSAKPDAAWALCGDVDGVVRSVDQGRNWLPMEMVDATVVNSSMKIAAIDGDTAFIAGSEGGWVVESQVATPAEGLAEGLYSHASFATEDVGYVVGYDGHLCRTTDGGYTWERVELP